MYDMNTIHSMLDNFIIQDIESCNYDSFQHDVNLYCYLKNLKDKVKTSFDLSRDDATVLYYLDQVLNETQVRLYAHSKIHGLIN